MFLESLKVSNMKRLITPRRKGFRSHEVCAIKDADGVIRTVDVR
jgi:hypothetical protein